MKKPILLLLGLGSIGQRHKCHAEALGYKVIWIDKTTKKDYYKFLDLSKNLTSYILICTPPHLHCEQVLDCLDRGYTVFCEKPLGTSLEEIEKILHHPRMAHCYVGYQLRFMQSLQNMKHMVPDCLQKGIIMSHSVFGHNMDNWKRLSNTPYETSANILLEASHELDYFLWALNYDINFYEDFHIHGAHLNKPFTRKIDTIFNGLLSYKTLFHNIQLDFETHQYTRTWTLRTQTMDLIWTYNSNEGKQAYKDELEAFLGINTQQQLLGTVKQAYVLHTLIDYLERFNVMVNYFQHTQNSRVISPASSF